MNNVATIHKENKTMSDNATDSPVTAQVPGQPPRENPADLTMRSFSHWLSTVDGGVLNAKLSAELKNLVAALADHQQSFGGAPGGNITISLGFKLEGNMMDVSSNVTVKEPKEKGGRSVYFVTPENNLTQSDPRQQKLPFGENRR